jgi:glycolate oxidase subunit GlcD|tara:strand:- start:2860 stop:4272 length:1413 start_codon:yes stop_codon:yes gene_type:complete
MRMLSSEINKFRKIVGNKNVITDKNDMQKYLKEWRGVYTGVAGAIVKPKSTKEVSNILKFAYRKNISCIPQGGNTGLVGGQIPFNRDHIVISLERLNKIREINPTDQSVTVEAGLILSDLQKKCDENNLIFPLSLASEGSCSLGGNIASNAGGVAVLYYGNTRELVMGLEVVLSDGSIINNLKTLIKDNTGYSIKDLFVGSEGTLGVITAATLKVFPKPKNIYTALLSVNSPKQSIEILNYIRNNLSIPLTAFELMNNFSIELVNKHMDKASIPIEKFKWLILVEFSSIEVSKNEKDKIENLLNEILHQNLAKDIFISQSLKQAEDMWYIRESISEAQKKEGGSIKNDISIPIKDISKFINNAEKISKEVIPGSRSVIFGHIGDGNIHFNISQPIKSDKDKFLKKDKKLRKKINDLTIELNGSISAEHGIGLTKKADLKKYMKKDVELFKLIKKSLDPKNIMNPGKIIDI